MSEGIKSEKEGIGQQPTGQSGVGLIASPDAIGQVSLPSMGMPGYSGPAILTNIDTTTEAGKRLLLQSTQDPDVRLDALDGEVFALAYWIAQPSEFMDPDSGEIRQMCRITMFSENGVMTACGSWSVARFLTMLLRIEGPGPWGEPINIRFHNSVRGDGKRTYTCERVEA